MDLMTSGHDSIGDPKAAIPEGAEQARSAAFALFSRLVSSPFDAGLAQGGLVPVDIEDALREVERALPYTIDLSLLLEAAQRLLEDGGTASEREYGAIFEVGRSGPPLPIRQELLFDETRSAQKKEEIVRYYEHFSYSLNPDRQWAPDHLSVALEFQHFLAYRASVAPDPETFLLASHDFSSRHLADWTSMLAQTVAHKSEDSYLRTLFHSVAAFIDADLRHLQHRLEIRESLA